MAGKIHTRHPHSEEGNLLLTLLLILHGMTHGMSYGARAATHVAVRAAQILPLERRPAGTVFGRISGLFPLAAAHGLLLSATVMLS